MIALLASTNAVNLSSVYEAERHHNGAGKQERLTSQLEDIRHEGEAAIAKIRKLGDLK